MTKNIGILGLGSIGARHAHNLVEMGHKVWGYDTEPHTVPGIIKASTVGALHKNCEAFVIATPTARHADDFISLPKTSPVFIEKPIFSLESAAIWERIAWPIFMVGNNLRFHSCVKKAKEWLTEGLIGKPLWASFCVAQHNTKYTDPVVLNWGAHEIDLALYLLGPATVTAAAGNDQIFDMCLLHEYGVPSTVHGDYVTDPEIRISKIIGDKGSITMDLANRTAWMTIQGQKWPTLFNDDNKSWDQDYRDEITTFIDLIDGKSVPHAATGQDGLHTLELILEAKRIAGIQ